MAKRRGTGRKVKGGGKSRTNYDHRHPSSRRINKGRWDDIVQSELRPERIASVIALRTAVDPDLPGLGQFYCVSCAKYCISQKALDDHQRQTKHKRRLKTLLTTKPYSHAEAAAGAGKGATDHGGPRSTATAMSTG